MCSPLRSGCLLRSRSCRPSGCLRQATQPAPAGMCSLPVDFATLHPSGCPRQSFSLRSIMSPYGLPSAGSVGSHPPRDVSPFGLLIQPTAQPPCCLVPSQRPLACDLRCATVASFAPAHLALRAAFGRLPSQRPLACVQVSGLRFFFPPPPESAASSSFLSEIELQQSQKGSQIANGYVHTALANLIGLIGGWSHEIILPFWIQGSKCL